MFLALKMGNVVVISAPLHKEPQPPELTDEEATGAVGTPPAPLLESGQLCLFGSNYKSQLRSLLDHANTNYNLLMK